MITDLTDNTFDHFANIYNLIFSDICICDQNQICYQKSLKIYSVTSKKFRVEEYRSLQLKADLNIKETATNTRM